MYSLSFQLPHPQQQYSQILLSRLMKSLQISDVSAQSPISISTFVLKAFTILSNPQNASVIRWHPSGLSFCILDPAELTQSILPAHFRHHKFESFIRQLNMYNFSKVKDAPCPSFTNPYFRRDREDLLKFIKRKPEKKKRKEIEEIEIENMGKMEEIIEGHVTRQPSICEHAEDIEKLNLSERSPEAKRINFDLPPQEDYSALIEASHKWINPREQKCWSNIKSFKSFKISLKELDRVQEEHLVLSEPKPIAPTSYGLLPALLAETTVSCCEYR